MTVYLAGPIEGVSLEEASKWRDNATSFFKKVYISTRDPLRRKKFHDQPYSKNLANKIVAMDVQDVRKSSTVLLNLLNRGNGKAWGSICELMIAHQAGKPVIVVLEEGYKHPFIDVYATEIHHTLEEAMEATLAYYR